MIGTVYRIEHQISGLGPYRERSIELLPIYKKLDAHNGQTFIRPVASIDFRPARVFLVFGSPNFSELYFGCDSLDSLLTWFEDCLDDLFKANFRIYKYSSVRRVKSESGRQVVFCKKGAFRQMISSDTRII